MATRARDAQSSLPPLPPLPSRALPASSSNTPIIGAPEAQGRLTHIAPPPPPADGSACPSPDSRPSTAEFTDVTSSGGAQAAPHGLALANGNTPLYSLSAARHPASETTRAADGAFRPFTSLPPALMAGSSSARGTPPPWSSSTSIAPSASAHGALSPMERSGFSHSVTDHEDIISPITPPYAHVPTRTLSEGTPIMRAPPIGHRNSLSGSVGSSPARRLAPPTR